MADPLRDVLDYAQDQKTTGFLVVRAGEVLARANWPLTARAPDPDFDEQLWRRLAPALA